MEFKNFLKDDLDINIGIKKKIFFLIKENLNFSIFNLFNYDDFEKVYFNDNKKFIYVNFVNNNINCLITYLTKENEYLLKNYFLKYIFKNPLKLLIFLSNPINLFKNIKPPKNYLQLFHFVNLNLELIERKKKYDSINYIHKNVIKEKYDGIYVIYKNNNNRAKKYYQNNGFNIYKKNLFYSLAIKKF